MSTASSPERSTVRSGAAFIGHGAPVYARWENPFTPTWSQIAHPRPRAVLVLSGHWYGSGLAVTAQDRPPTIHDFGGIGQEFFDITYPAPGASWLVDRVSELVSPAPVERSSNWGLDHGAWTVLMHLWPEADIPVVQLRIDSDLGASGQLELGRRLSPLRDEGVMLLGSGNIVHNLAEMRLDQLGFDAREAAPWNDRFDAYVADALSRRDLDELARWADHPDAPLAAPTPDHFLPLLVIAGAARSDDTLLTLTEGPDAWSISMRSVIFA